MPSAAQTVPVSKTMLWAGRILSTLAVLFMLFDAALRLAKPAPVAVAFAQLGYPLDLAVGIGILELVCVALYVIPRTSPKRLGGTPTYSSTCCSASAG